MIDAIRKELALATVEPQQTDLFAAMNRAMTRVGMEFMDSVSTRNRKTFSCKTGNHLLFYADLNLETKAIKLMGSDLPEIKATPAGIASVAKLCAAVIEMAKHRV